MLCKYDEERPDPFELPAFKTCPNTVRRQRIKARWVWMRSGPA